MIMSTWLPLLVKITMATTTMVVFVDGRWNLLMNEIETRRILGVPGDLYYVRNGQPNDYALAFNLPLKPNITELFFDWNATYSQRPVEYRLTLSVSNPTAMSTPVVNIPLVGRIPTRTASFRIRIPCTGLVAIDVDIRLTLNVSFGSSNHTTLEIRRRKPCLIDKNQEEEIHFQAKDHKKSETIKIARHDAVEQNAEQSSDSSDASSPSTTTGSKSTSTIIYVSLGCLVVVAASFAALALTCRQRRRRLHRRHTSDLGCRRNMQLPVKSAMERQANVLSASPAVGALKSQEDVFVCSEKLHCQSANDSAYVTAYNSNIITALPFVPTTGSRVPSSTYHPAIRSRLPSCGHAMIPPDMMSSSGSSLSLTADGSRPSAPDDLTWITRRQISIRNLILEGTHGLLYYGTVTSSEGDNVTSAIGRSLIVKTVTDIAEGEDIESMLQDACLLRGVKHDNLKSVVTVCFEPHLKPLLVYRCDNDCYLKIYLQLCKTSQLPTSAQQVYLAAQITCGLQFLHQRQICHRDVATRNCLVADRLRVRLTDNALAWTLFPRDYDEAPRGDVIAVSNASAGMGRSGCYARTPVRWTAVERLTGRQMTPSQQADVWSMGVTMWEMATGGANPYSDIEDRETVASFVKMGRRLPQPTECPLELYSLMSRCWSEIPEQRPTSAQLNAVLQQLYNRMSSHFV